MKTITTLLLVFFGITQSFAQTALEKQQKETVAVTAEADEECPNARPLRGICEHVITPDLVRGELSYVTRFKKQAV